MKFKIYYIPIALLILTVASLATWLLFFSQSYFLRKQSNSIALQQFIEAQSADYREHPSTLDVNNLYRKCTGHAFYGKCRNEECIEAGLERRIFNIWKNQFNFSDAQFQAHIELDEAKLIPDDSQPTSWYVQYIFHNDWLRTRHNEDINEYVDAQTLLENEKAFLEQLKVERDIRRKNGTLPPETPLPKIISLEQLKKLLPSSYEGHKLYYDFCHIYSKKLEGGATLNYGQNECAQVLFDLQTASSTYAKTVCWIN